MQQLNQLVPDAVRRDFGPDVPILERVAPERTRQVIDRIWRAGAPGQAAA